jgi:hypothetical protein
MRKSGLQLDGYPNYIAPYNIDKLSRRHHPLGNFPIYPKKTEPAIWFEEQLASDRYKNLVDEWCRIFDVPRQSVVQPGMPIIVLLSNVFQAMLSREHGNYRQLEAIAEDVVRQYYNLGKDEVIFDLEILDPTTGDKPANHFDFNKGEEETTIDDPQYTEDVRDEIMRRRLTNALQQGAALKGHYLFHMATPRLNELTPGLAGLYNESMITNDLYYYYIDDVICSKATEEEMQAGMMQVDFSGEIPIIKVKAMCFTVLVHEMVKGVMELLTAHGIPKDQHKAKYVLDLCDTVLNEFWDIRLGPKLWEQFYALVDQEDHPLLKHIIIGVAKLETPAFLGFMQAMFAGEPEAKQVITKIVRDKKAEIADYAIHKDEYTETSEDESDDDGIDWSTLM